MPSKTVAAFREAIKDAEVPLAHFDTISTNHRTMTTRLACHYSVLRFAPYPETDEFVNVGVVLACPALGYLDFKHANPLRHNRVTLFFPELAPGVYSAAMQAWAESLKSHRRTLAKPQTREDDDLQQRRELFKFLVRPRESILYYSEARVILADNPATTLDQVFSAYVERHKITHDGAAPERANN